MTTDHRGCTTTELPAMRNRKGLGFTLIELLVVIAIIALLVTLLVPALQAAKRQARVVLCTTNLRSYATGMTTYSAEDDKNEYPQNTSPNPGLPFMVGCGYPDAHVWLDLYLEVVCGGNGDVLWCPLDRDQRPGPKSPFYYDVDAVTDPRYGDAFFYYNNGQLYWIGYATFAGLSASNADWSHSGNMDPAGRPPMRPGSSRDAILADIIMSDTGFIDNHGDNPRDYTAYRENAAAYSDVHVEIHHNEFTSLSPYPHWDEHYVRSPGGSSGTYWLY